MVLAQQGQSPASVLWRERAAEFFEERRYIVRSPIPRYYALLVGLALTPLGMVGFVPQFTRGNLLFHTLRDSIIMSGIYLVTGVAGLCAAIFRKGHYAHLFTLVVTGVYLVLFSAGNIAFGNTEGTTGGPLDVPWILENALHAGLMLTGALITGLAALQHGDRATARALKQRYGLTDSRAHNARGPDGDTRGVERALKMHSPRRLGRSLVAGSLRAVVLLALAVAAVVLYDITVEVIERHAAERLLHSDEEAVRHAKDEREARTRFLRLSS